MTGFKTIGFNIIMLIVSVGVLIGADTSEISDPEKVKAGLDTMEQALIFAFGIGNVVLRFFTRTPIFKKE